MVSLRITWIHFGLSRRPSIGLPLVGRRFRKASFERSCLDEGCQVPFGQVIGFDPEPSA